MTTSSKDLHDELARQETRLVDLDREREQIRGQIDELRSRLTTPSSIPGVTPRDPVVADRALPTTPAEKVALFRRLFRGRADVFPRRWENPKKGKAGYAPACFNEWVRGVCEKPRIKCGECPNQAFIPVDDQVVLDHLQGRHVAGVYPLLEDETCWFLATDFDKASWKDDVAAFVDTCRTVGVPHSLERSRSGNGAHVWFFFASALPANLARKMGCYLITETMARRHELNMQSYDRLFPNQDTMPRGGFGNLIALPLQFESRKHGNTVFLDDSLEAYTDQWAYLASVERTDASQVEAIACEATRQGRILGVRFPAPADDEDRAPWMRLPSGHPRSVRITEPLPSEVQAALSQRLFVDRADLPAALLNEIKRLAAFQNPEFYKKQSLRLSTALTPRVIACAEELPQYIVLPRALAADLEECLWQHGVGLRIDDQRCEGDALDLRFRGELTSLQQRAARALLEHDIGVFVAPPGVGKTVLGTYLIAQRQRSTLVLVHRRPLLDQWVTQLAMFLGIGEKEIGQVGGGKRRLNGRIDVAMIQSLARSGRVDDVVANYGHVVVDECHHVPAVSFERVLSEVKARYIVGLTATPQRRDGHDPITEMQLGPVRFAVEARSHAARRPFDHHLIVRETSFRRAPDTDRALGIQDVYRELAHDDARNELILNDVISAIHEGRSPILLTERKDHLDLFATRLQRFVRHLIVLHGGLSRKKRRHLAAQIVNVPDAEERLVLATGRYIGEGFDDARLDTLFLAMPVAWKGTLVQYTGRLHRLHARKKEVRIFDYVDRNVPMLLRMFEKRLKTYRAIGYARGEAPLGYGEPTDEPIVEYDEAALRDLDDHD